MTTDADDTEQTTAQDAGDAAGEHDPEVPASHRFRILACIDGSEDSYRGLKYAAKIAHGHDDVDIVLLYVRPVDHGLRSGGLQMDVARGNMLQWGIELPGIKHLKKGRDMLREMGVLGEDWDQEAFHSEVQDTKLGDNKIEYTAKSGKMVVLKLKVASDVATGVLEQWELGEYDLIIIGASSRWTKRGITGFFDPAVAEKIAIHAPCSVLVTRDLEEGHGHLVCTDGSEAATEAVKKDAWIASHCDCPISLMSVALDVESEDEAKRHVKEARNMLLEMGVGVEETITKVGNPVDEIIEEGAGYSIIALADSGKSGIERFFMGSVALKVMQNAYNSVMIVR